MGRLRLHWLCASLTESVDFEFPLSHVLIISTYTRCFLQSCFEVPRVKNSSVFTYNVQRVPESDFWNRLMFRIFFTTELSGHPRLLSCIPRFTSKTTSIFTTGIFSMGGSRFKPPKAKNETFHPTIHRPSNFDRNRMYPYSSIRRPDFQGSTEPEWPPGRSYQHSARWCICTSVSCASGPLRSQPSGSSFNG